MARKATKGTATKRAPASRKAASTTGSAKGSHAALAARLDDAFTTRTPCAPLKADFPELTIADAYAIQTRNIDARRRRGLHGRPARVVGFKVGITSRAVMEWLKVDQPDFGHLLDDMIVPDGFDADTRVLLQPRAEGEIAFVLRHELAGPGVTVVDVLRATDFVLPAIEIIDSRIKDWKLSVEDTIADNASSGLFVLGSTPASVRGIDLGLAGMSLKKNGRVVSTGVGRNCLAHPANAVAWLANTLGALGQSLLPGHVVLSGALGPVTPVAKGDALTLDVAHIGSARVGFV